MACTSKNNEKSVDLDEENDVDGVLKADYDKVYLFARNDPEKELWYHRLNLAASFDVMAADDPDNKKKKNVEEYDKFHKAYIAYIRNVYELANYTVVTDILKKKEVCFY